MPVTTQEEVLAAYGRLDQYLDEARAGIPDYWLAKKAECSTYLVKKWRKMNDIKKSPGPSKSSQAKSYAVNLLGRPIKDVLQRTSTSKLDGKWEPPMYVLRKALDYEQLVKQIHFLHRRGGFSLETIARAHGYKMTTVRQAVQIGDRMHVEANNA